MHIAITLRFTVKVTAQNAIFDPYESPNDFLILSIFKVDLELKLLTLSVTLGHTFMYQRSTPINITTI